MAITNWRLGWVQPTEINLWVRSDNGLSYRCGVTVVGGPIPDPVATSDGDNTANIQATGLTPETPYDIWVDSVVVKTITTPPADTDKPIRIMTTNCYGKNANFHLGKIVTDRNPDLFSWNSDNGYESYNETLWGIPLTDLRSAGPAVPVSDFRDQYRCFETVPGVSRVNQNVPNIWIPGNHEWGADRDDHSQASWGSPTGWPETFQSYANAMQVMDEYRPDPPYARPVDPADNDIPINPFVWGVEGVDYFNEDYVARWYEGAMGCVDIFVLDCTGGKHPNDWFSEGQKAMFGPNQLAWAWDRINSSTNVWRAVFFAYPLSAFEWNPLDQPGINGWSGRPTKMKQFLDGITKKAGTVFISGDWHAASIMTGEGDYQYASTNMGSGGARGHGALVTFDQRSGLIGQDIIYAAERQNAPLEQDTVGQFDFTPELLTVTAVNAQNEELMRVTMLPTESTWTLPVENPATLDAAYDQMIDDYTLVGRDDTALNWYNNELNVPIHGWGTPPGTNTYDMGMCWQPGLASGTPIRAAFIYVNVVAVTSLVDEELRIFLDDPALSDDPWGPGDTPRQMNKTGTGATGWGDFILAAFSSIGTGLSTGRYMLDVTPLVQQWINDPSHNINKWLRWNLGFKQGSDDLDIEGLTDTGGNGNAPRMVILTYD